MSVPFYYDTMRNNLLILVLSLAFLAGCVTTATNTENCFYGIGMNSAYDSKDFKVFLSKDGELQYNSNDKIMNKDIYAWANYDAKYACLGITVYNSTATAIPTSALTDSFNLVTTEDKIINLKKRSLALYPSSGYINPGCRVLYFLNNPYGADSKKLVSKTAMIICELGTLSERVTIVLKPVPKGR